MTQIAIVNGSVQENNYLGFALEILKNEFKKHKNYSVNEINLIEFNLPFPGEKIKNDDSVRLRKILKSADAFVLGTPEYHGTFTAKLKLMIENSGYPSLLKGKPVSLLGIASGTLGAVKSLEHLRSVCSHIGSFTLPRVVSISHVESRFNAEGKCLDKEIENEIRNLAKNLINFLTSINKHLSA
ncbi:MAG: NAD(P)H-dependent oxidoreductase [Ignavibacteriales bacterium]|nr:NAD(P)H-dependent oxidoreductase [Ignavibacteriales bacterium]